jgi:hypothetical protein
VPLLSGRVSSIHPVDAKTGIPGMDLR